MNFCVFAEPSKQFALVEDHIMRCRSTYNIFFNSHVVIYCERNLGFEAEHHHAALSHLPKVTFRVDEKAQRFGVLTTNEIKHGMCTLTNHMLREKRIHVAEPFISVDPAAVKRRLREQMETYSYQFKQAVDTFGKDRIALSGKVGGMKDDICIVLQLALYFTDLDARKL